MKDKSIEINYSIGSNYSFSILPDNSRWVLYLDEHERRLMGRGNPFTDTLYTEFIDSIDDGEISDLLKVLIKKYKVNEVPALLMEADRGSCKFILGDVNAITAKISYLLQKLVDSYK
jgi:hypothetical protein